MRLSPNQEATVRALREHVAALNHQLVLAEQQGLRVDLSVQEPMFRECGGVTPRYTLEMEIFAAVKEAF